MRMEESNEWREEVEREKNRNRLHQYYQANSMGPLPYLRIFVFPKMI